MIVRTEHGEQGANPRYVVTNRHDAAPRIYDTLYSQRGEMENRIWEQQLGLFAEPHQLLGLVGESISPDSSVAGLRPDAGGRAARVAQRRYATMDVKSAH